MASSSLPPPPLRPLFIRFMPSLRKSMFTHSYTSSRDCDLIDEHHGTRYSNPPPPASPVRRNPRPDEALAPFSVPQPASSQDPLVVQLTSTIERTREILHDECSRGDDFGRLALALLAKELAGLTGTLELIRRNDEGFRRPEKPRLSPLATTTEAMRAAADARIPRVSPLDGPVLSQSRRNVDSATPPEVDVNSSVPVIDHESREEPLSPRPQAQRQRRRRGAARPDDVEESEQRPRTEPDAPVSLPTSPTTSHTHFRDQNSPLIFQPSSPALSLRSKSSTRRRAAATLLEEDPRVRIIPSLPLHEDPSQESRKSKSRAGTDYSAESDRESSSRRRGGHDSERRSGTSKSKEWHDANEELELEFGSRSSGPAVGGSRRRRGRPRPPPPAMSDSETSSLGGGPHGRSGSKASSVRPSGRRGKDVERILSTASAPPEDDAEPTPPLPPPTKAPVRLNNERVFRRIAEQLSLLGGTETLLSLALVSKRASAAVTPVLYEAPVLASLRSIEKLSEIVAGSYDHSGLVERLIIKPIGGPVKNLFEPLQIITAACSDLTTFDEDFSTSDWDVTTLQTDYPPIESRLRTFTSRRCWWEIGALAQLLQTQPELRELKILGALMDREWEGERINTLPCPPVGLAPHLTSITLTQVLHEETLSALFRTAGTSSLRVLRLGFEQIDQDTPRASIVDAVRLVGATLTHLAIVAPSKSSPDAEGLLADILPFLPHLVTLEFAEQADNPIARGILSVLPMPLKVLRGRSVVSFSSSRLLALIDESGSGTPALRELDVFWAAEDRPDREVSFRERHRARILSASEELGIRCSIGKSDKGLEVW